MSKLRVVTVMSAMLLAVAALAAGQTTPSAAAPSPGTPFSMTPNDLTKLIDLTQTAGSFPKCRPSICAYFGITTKPLFLMSELRCDMPDGNRASFAMFSRAESGYLFSLTINQKDRLYVVHTDTHLKLLGAIVTRNDASGIVDIKRLENADSAQLLGIASRTMSRCIHAFP